MKRCIFCGKTEDEFDKNNCWTEEHIIPEALGNETLKIYNVCKVCNSKLGTYVDNYFSNNMIIKMIRQEKGLGGQSGIVPNAFREGKDKDGHRIRLDENFHPTTVPYIEQDCDRVKIVAPSKEEAKKMVQKKLSRMNISQNVIEDVLKEVDKAERHSYQPKIQYDFVIEYNRFFMEALKIAFEYAVYKLGDEYLNDSRAIEIQQYLNNAIDGKMKKECKSFPGVSLIHNEIGKILKLYKDMNFHMLMIHPAVDNKLIAEVILFVNPALSFSVIISNDAHKFDDVSFTDIVNIKTNSQLPQFTNNNYINL
ncbi:MAG: HNH endonuclease [Clostridium sp.]|nr:HNH endonuclease [Clostridium sp.]